jgi:ABC-type polar amino acid transport system ATPase subunit
MMHRHGVGAVDEMTSALDPQRVGHVLNVVRTRAQTGMSMAADPRDGICTQSRQDDSFLTMAQSSKSRQVLGQPQNPRTQALLAQF